MRSYPQSHRNTRTHYCTYGCAQRSHFIMYTYWEWFCKMAEALRAKCCTMWSWLHWTVATISTAALSCWKPAMSVPMMLSRAEVWELWSSLKQWKSTVMFLKPFDDDMSLVTPCIITLVVWINCSREGLSWIINSVKMLFAASSDSLIIKLQKGPEFVSNFFSWTSMVLMLLHPLPTLSYLTTSAHAAGQ